MNAKIIIVLIALSTHGTYWCMKRSGPKKEHTITKKHRTLTMNRVNGNINGQLKALRDKSKIDEKIPADITSLIKQKFFLKDKEWWYPERKLSLDPGDSIYGLSFFHNDKLAIGLKNKTVRIINYTTHELLSSFKTKDEVLSLAVTNDEQILAYGLDNGIIKIVQLLPPYKELYSLDMHQSVWSLAFNHNSTHLICGLNDNTVQLVTISTGASQLLLQARTTPYGLSWHDNERFICGRYNRLTTINTTNLSQLIFPKQFAQLFTLACNYKSTKLATGSNSGVLHITDLQTHNTLMQATLAHSIYSLSLNQNNQRMAVGLNNGIIHFFTQHAHPTTQQLMLRKILYLWLQCKKQSKKIGSPKILLINIANLFNIRYKELSHTWSSFPQAMQIAIWKHMNKLIQKYGK